MLTLSHTMLECVLTSRLLVYIVLIFQFGVKTQHMCDRRELVLLTDINVIVMCRCD